MKSAWSNSTPTPTRITTPPVSIRNLSSSMVTCLVELARSETGCGQVDPVADEVGDHRVAGLLVEHEPTDTRPAGQAVQPGWRACAAEARPLRASRRRSTPSGRRCPRTRTRQRCGLRQRSSPRDVPRRTAGQELRGQGDRRQLRSRPTAGRSLAGIPPLDRSATCRECPAGSRTAPPGLSGAASHQPSVARPMTPLLPSPCIALSRRCASTPSSKFTSPRSSTPRPYPTR